MKVMLAAGVVQHMLMVVTAGRTILVVELRALVWVGLPSIRGLLGVV
jgi:hypothetical protein